LAGHRDRARDPSPVAPVAEAAYGGLLRAETNSQINLRGNVMIRTICAVLVLAVTTPAFAPVVTPALADTLKLASTYDEVGTNADGSKYTGTATVDVISDTTFAIKWKIGSTVYSGFGMRRGDTLAATYQVNGQPGLILYTVGEGGVLTGNWSIRGENGSGTDRLTPRN